MTASNVMSNFWNWAVQAVDQRPGLVLVGVFLALMIVLLLSTIVLFARLRILGKRQRQLQRSLERQGSEVERQASEVVQTKAYINAKIQILLAHQERAISALSTATQKSPQEFPVDLMREELASVHMDFLAGKEKDTESQATDS